MQEVRCKACNKVLAKATMMVAAIKCPRCYMIFEYKIYSNTLYEPLQNKNSYANFNEETTESELNPYKYG